MNVLDLFSGIGGFSLGLERAGMRTVAFCEIDPYCRRVLAKHWPTVPCYDDVRTLTAARLAADGTIAALANANSNGRGDGATSGQPGLPTGQERGDISSGITQWQSIQRTTERRGIDLICGGFPCQDISVAGKGAGIGGERSGLWTDYARIIGEVRPRFVIVENVAALLGRGLARVLGDLAALGFDAEWHCIPASAVGAPHRRDRIWIIAYRDRRRCEGERLAQHGEQQGPSGHIADGLRAPGRRNGALADADRRRCEQRDAGERQFPILEPSSLGQSSQWWFEPDVGRVAHGVPARVDRLRSLGNAVVPQIPEIIGRAILAYEVQWAAAHYDGQADLGASYDACLAAIRERQGAGGPGWTPKGPKT